MVIVMKYGELMDDIRFEHEIKQKDMAKIMGIAPAAYNAYEKESLIIPLKHLIKFCDYFNISLDYILGFSKERNYPNMKKEADKKTAGFRIRKFRKSLNLTQQNFAKELKIPGSTLSEYEHGKVLIPTALLYEVCKRYNISADFILGRIENQELTIN